MLRRYLISTVFFLLFACEAAHAQLGPKDGANLPPADLERVKVGDQAPDFTLENMDGKRISLADFRGKKNVGVEYGGDSRAYPVPTLSRHEIVNDKVGGIPIAVTW